MVCWGILYLLCSQYSTLGSAVLRFGAGFVIPVGGNSERWLDVLIVGRDFERCCSATLVRRRAHSAVLLRLFAFQAIEQWPAEAVYVLAQGLEFLLRKGVAQQGKMLFHHLDRHTQHPDSAELPYAHGGRF